MNLKYVNKIKSNIMIYSKNKSTNILDGTYNSIYKGKSSNFEDLREYVIGDNVKDIDWKATARTGVTLVRQFRAEKKHNIMVVLDTGKKMQADSKNYESKKEISIMTAGTISYLASNHGDYVGAIYNKEKEIEYFPFKLGSFNIEKILTNYEKDIQNTDSSYLNDTLDYINKYIKKKMIIFIVTDLSGMDEINENTLKILSTTNDILLVNISDANITGNNAYDIEKEKHIPSFITNNDKLRELEKNTKLEIYNKCIDKFKKAKVQVETIDETSDIITKIMNLIERHKHANIG